MSGHPDPGDHPMTVVRDTDPATVALAESAIARRAQAGGWSRTELVDVLEHLGLRAPVKPTGGEDNPDRGERDTGCAAAPQGPEERPEAGSPRRRQGEGRVVTVEFEHDLNEDCVCGPTPIPVEREDGSVGWVIQHHSLDGRELREGSS